MNHTTTRPFLTGMFAGIAISICAAVMLAFSDSNRNDDRPAEPPTRQVEPVYFVTGDATNATLWRRDADGFLTCVSRNVCRAAERTR
jgi:hypothetical protein